MRQSRRGKQQPGSVRIIGGNWRSRQIPVAAGTGLRPTPDRVRETLFNWLGPVLPGAACLDLFAGTGVLGFEALSRGADSAVLVELEQRAIVALERLRVELEADASIVGGDARTWLSGQPRLEFDIVFVDPPYAQPVDLLLAQLASRLPEGARVFLERDRDSDWPEVDRVRWQRRSVAGAVAFGLGVIGPK